MPPFNAYWGTELTGGGVGAADKIPTASLADKDTVFVPRLSDTQTYIYAIDDDLGGTENSPSLLKPDDESGNKRLTLLGLTVPNTGLHILDSNASHDLIIKPGSNLNADREFTITTGDAARTLTMNENFTIGDGTDITITGVTAARTITLNENLTIGDGTDITLTGVTQANTFTMNESFTIGDGNDGTLTYSAASKTLTVENNAIVSQDYSSDASPTFANVSLGTGELTTGSINRTSGTMTLEIAGSTILSIASADVTLADGIGLNLQEDITFTGATTENQIKIPDNLLDALSVLQGANKYMTFDTVNDEEDIFFYKSVDILHTAIHANDHTLEIDTDAATHGDVKAIDIDYITGNIIAGKDEGIILINIDETLATGGEVFGLEILTTDQVTGSTSIHGMKVGPLISPIHQDSGTFENPTTSTDNAVDESDMRDGVLATTTTIFEALNEYIVIGAAAAFQDLELIFSTPGNKSIKPTFHYSTGGTGFTAFTPVDGTDGCRHTGVISWDDSDVPSHAANATGTFDIKIIRTRASSTMTAPVLGYAKTAATTEYVWDENGDLSIRAVSGTSTATFEGASVTVGKASTTSGTLVLHDSNSANTITLTVPDISAGSLTFTLPPTDGDNTNLLQTNGSGVLTWTAAGAGDVTAGAVMTDHSIVRGDGGAKGIQDSAIIIDDSDNMSGVTSLIIDDAGTIGSVSDTDAIAISAVGILDFTGQSGCRVYLATANDQPIPVNTDVIIQLETEDFDTQNEFDNSVKTGTDDAGTPNKLSDNGVFDAGDLGATVWNTTDNTYATITNIDSADVVSIDADIMDIGEGYDVYWSKFTATATGHYLIAARTTVQVNADQDRIQAKILVNGSAVGGGEIAASGNSTQGIAMGDIIPLSANDYVQMSAKNINNSDTISAGTRDTYLAIKKVS